MPAAIIIPHTLTDNNEPLSLNNNTTTVNHNLESEIKSANLSGISNGMLKAWFSVPIGIIDPKVSDITAVHIASIQAEAVLASRTDLSGLSTNQIGKIVKELADSLPKFTFPVTITSFSADKSTSTNHTMTENARTMLEAIGQAMIFTVAEIYDELPSGYYDDAIITTLKNCLREDELLAVKFGEDSMNHVVTGITQQALCHSNMPNLVIPKDTGMFYATPDCTMITDLDRTVNVISQSDKEGVLADVDKEVLLDLRYSKLSVGFTTHSPITAEPLQLSDIKQVYLFNYANVIVAQSDDVSNLDNDKLSKTIHKLIHGSQDHGWTIEVITNRRGVTSRSMVKRNGIHALEAVESGLMFLADFANNDFDAAVKGGTGYETKLLWVKDAVKRCASTGQQIVLTISNTTHTVMSVTQREFVSYEEENNLM